MWLVIRAGCLMFDEALPSEIVPAHLPVLHDNWSSIRSLRDADFEKTGVVLLKGLPCSSQITRNRKEDTTIVTTSSVATKSKELNYFGRMQVRANPVPLAAQNKPKTTGTRSRGVILLVHDESSRCNFCTANSNNLKLSIQQEHDVACPGHPRQGAPEVFSL